MTASGREVRGVGIEQKGKRTHGQGQQCGDCWGEGSTTRLNGNGKNTIKIKEKCHIGAKMVGSYYYCYFL